MNQFLSLAVEVEAVVLDEIHIIRKPDHLFLRISGHVAGELAHQLFVCALIF